VNCLAVRERLPEHTLHLLEDAEATSIDRHVEWCAACRKEFADLGEAVVAIPVALTGRAPAAELEDRVVDAVRSAAGSNRTSRGRARMAAVAVVAAFVAVAGLGWGAVMAGRADRFSATAKAAVQQQQVAIARFESLIATLPGTVPTDHPRLGDLSPTPGNGNVAGGTALMLTNGAGPDYAFVILNGVQQKRVGPLPYRVDLEDAAHSGVTVGRITSLQGGSAQLIKSFGRELLPFSRVKVVDANGDVVMSGTIGTDSPQSAR
jgi:hypothetical protein